MSVFPWRLNLLGGVRLHVAGQDLTPRIRYRKGLALLALLAERGGTRLHRRELAAWLWPGLITSAALTNLRQVVCHLSALLSEAGLAQALVVKRDSLSLSQALLGQAEIDLLWLRQASARLPDTPDQAFDTWLQTEFEPRREALTGTALDGLEIDAGHEFDDWVRQLRSEVDQRMERLLLALQQAQERGERPAAAALTARQRWERQPLDEAAAQDLIRLLRQCGDEPGARTVYARLEQLLVSQLGLRPRLALATEAASAPAPVPTHAGAPAAAGRRRWTCLAWLAWTGGAGEATDAAAGLLQAQRDLARWDALCYPVFGNGFLALFGHGSQQADAALRAAAACHALAQSQPLRIGLAAGQVDWLDTPDQLLPGLAGSLPERVQAIAQRAAPGQVLLAAEMRAALGQRGRWRRQSSEFGAGPLYVAQERTPPRTPARKLVGRDAQLEPLWRAWSQVLDGHPVSVVLRGEAGIGKSTLAHSFGRQLGSAALVVRMPCLLQEQHRPLAPWLRLIERAARLPESASTERRRERLRSWLRHHWPEREGLPDAELLLALCTHDSTGPLAQQVLELAHELLRSLCRRRPVLLLVDDLQWSDRMSRELLTRCAAWADQGERLMLLMTTRPDVDLPPGGADLQWLDVPPMDDAEVAELIDRIDTDRRLSPRQRSDIRLNCAGLPLMVAAQTDGLLHDAHHLLPLHLLLQAELDRMGRFRFMLEVAAVCGQVFDANRLHALLPDAPVEDVLRLARQLGLLQPAGDGRQRFRHALLHEAAYAALPEPERRGWHLRLAEALLAQESSDDAELASHLEAAGTPQRAIKHWLRAGESALAREFAADALAHFQRGLALAESLHDADTSRRLRIAIGAAALQCEGYGSALAWNSHKAVYEALAAATDDTALEQRFHALAGMYWGAASQGRNDGLAIAAALETAATTPAQRLMACFAQGNSLFWAGRFREALRYQDEGLSLVATCAETATSAICRRYSHDDLAVLIQSFRAWNHWFLGKEQAARRDAEQALSRARSGGRHHELCFALSFAAGMSWTARDVEAVLVHAGQGAQLGRRHGFPLWQGVNELFLAWAAAQQGELRDTAPLLAAAEQMQRSYQAGTTTARWVMATTLVRLSAWREARALIVQTLQDAMVMGDDYCRSDLLRLLAACEGRRGRQDELLHEAMELARRQQAEGLLGLLKPLVPSTPLTQEPVRRR